MQQIEQKYTYVKDVFNVIEREGYEKAIWKKVGVAFVNKDQSLSIKLDALPLNGFLQVRDRVPMKPAETPVHQSAEELDE